MRYAPAIGVTLGGLVLVALIGLAAMVAGHDEELCRRRAAAAEISYHDRMAAASDYYWWHEHGAAIIEKLRNERLAQNAK